MVGAELGRVLGLDLGDRRIGVAISDSARTVASPLDSVDRRADSERGHTSLIALVDEWEVRVVVVGLPLGLNGRMGPAAAKVVAEVGEFSRVLGRCGVEVVTHDERFTTVEADRALAEAGMPGRERRKRVDSQAATVMLQSWLEASAR